LRHCHGDTDLIVAHPVDVAAWLTERVDLEPEALWERLSTSRR
jgi:hypothetical protein